MADFFVSYTSADEAWAEWIGFVLEEEGFTVVIQAWDFRPGSNFVLEMQRAATEADWGARMQSFTTENLAQSALDYSWMTRVDSSAGVFITAEGLLMYLQPREAMDLIAACAERFPGGQMFFDVPPTLVKKVAPRGMRSSRHYRVPPMPFSLSPRQLAGLPQTVPGISAVHDVPIPKGRGLFFGTLFPTFWQWGPIKNLRGAYTLLEFA